MNNIRYNAVPRIYSCSSVGHIPPDISSLGRFLQFWGGKRPREEMSGGICPGNMSRGNVRFPIMGALALTSFLHHFMPFRDGILSQQNVTLWTPVRFVSF